MLSEHFNGEEIVMWTKEGAATADLALLSEELVKEIYGELHSPVPVQSQSGHSPVTVRDTVRSQSQLQSHHLPARLVTLSGARWLAGSMAVRCRSFLEPPARIADCA
eukprot:3783763-Pyramimonas_sp.AAC.1